MSPNPEEDSCDSDAIVRVTSYHRRDFDQAVIAAKPGQHDHARLSIFKVLGPSGSSSLGRLQHLPLEVITYICLGLDVCSALAFSQVSRRTREIVAGIRQYRQLSEHALECLWALFRTSLAARTDISTLHSALSTKSCVLCGLFGGFIFLPTTARCCFQCIESAPDLRTVSLHSFCKASGMPATRLKKSCSVRGTVAVEEPEFTRREGAL